MIAFLTGAATASYPWWEAILLGTTVGVVIGLGIAGLIWITDRIGLWSSPTT